MPLSQEIQLVAISAIHVRRDERQRREVIIDDHFVNSIRKRGVMNPILVRALPEGQYELIAGERRLEGSKAAGLLEIPVRCAIDLTEIDLQIYEYEENAKRSDLAWQENVSAIQRVHQLHLAQDAGWTMGETAEVCAVALSHVSLCLRVAKCLDDQRIADCSSAREAYNVIKRREDREDAHTLEELLAPPTAVAADVKHGGTMSDADLPAVAPRLSVVPPSPAPPGEARCTPLPSAGPHLTIAVPPSPPPSILCASFLDFAPSYTGPKFNFLHCDFPYGVQVFGGGQGGFGKTAEDDKYSDNPDDYFALLECLLTNLNKLMSLSGYIMFWYSETHGPRTREMFQNAGLGLELWKFPLVWLKSDGLGISSDASRKARHTYETCLIAVRGDRRLAKVMSDGYAAPTDRKLHSSTKPEPMLRHFMSMFVDDTTSLFDPTCGSGSALRAAESLGAKSVLGLEINPDYAKTANQALVNARLLRGTST